MSLYAFAVKIENNSNLFEVFELINVEDTQSMSNRWKQAFAAGNVSLIQNVNVEKISMGSKWDGENFIFNEDGEVLKYYNKDNAAIMLSNNLVYGGILFADEPHSRAMQIAAVNSENIGIDVTDIPGVNLGSIWDGTSFKEVQV